MMQHIGIFVQAQLEANLAGGKELIVFGDFVTIFIEDFQTETLLKFITILLAMFQLKLKDKKGKNKLMMVN